MKQLFLFIILILFSSCDLLDSENFIGKKRSDITRDGETNRNLPPPGPEIPVSDTLIYLSAVEFDKDYDWVRDTANGNVNFNLVLFVNGKKTISVPSLENGLLTPDPDMHFLVGGHLYTGGIDGGETVIQCDGAELFRYEGAEVIKGFLLKEDGIYTLGQNKKGEGFTYRKNGLEIFGSDAGYVLGDMCEPGRETGALFDNKGSVCFVYYLPISGISSGYRPWFIVEDGLKSKIEPVKELSEIFDISIVDGKKCFLGSIGKGGRLPVLIVEQKIISLLASGMEFMKNGRLIVSDNKIFVKGSIIAWDGASYNTVLWNQDGQRESLLSSENNAAYFYFENGTYSYPLLNGLSYLSGICHEGKYYPVAEKISMISNKCAVLKGGKFYAGLTSFKPGSSPFLWKNGKEIPLNFNGYFTSIHVVIK